MTAGNDQNNPYLSQQASVQSAPVVESSDEQRMIIADQDGERHLVGVVQEVVLLNPATGERRFIRSQYLIRSEDGRLMLNPGKEQIYNCSTCGRKGLTQFSIHFCVCQTVHCLNCIHELQDEQGNPLYFCKPCFRKERIRRFFRWLFSIRIEA